MADLERELGVLLDQQDRDAFARDLQHRFEDLLHHQRREPHRRLVEQQQLRLRHQRARHREHLLLAAGQRAGGLPAALLEAGKEIEHALDVVLDRGPVAADVGAHREIFLDGQRAEHAAALGDHGEAVAHELERRAAGHVLAGVTDRAALHRLQAGDALQRRRLPGAVGADQADELALVDVEVDALDRLDAAVGDFDLLQLEQRVRAGAASRVTRRPSD